MPSRFELIWLTLREGQGSFTYFIGYVILQIFCFLLYCLVQLFCTQLFRTHPVWTFFQSRNGCHSLQPENFQFKENIQFNTTQSYCYTIRRFSFGFFESSDDCLSASMWSSGYWSEGNQTTSLSCPWPGDLRFACVGHQMPYFIIV